MKLLPSLLALFALLLDAVAPAASVEVEVTLKPATPWVPCNASAGICFSHALGSHMVLQQAPAAACVYGLLGAGGTEAKVKITGNGGGSSTVAAEASEVAVEVTPAAGGGKAWKACLPPQKAGGDYTITATCTVGCLAGASPALLEHVVFGDVWYCSGQSNMVRTTASAERLIDL